MQKENKTSGSTSTLFEKLFVEPDIEKILESNIDDFEVLPFHEYLSNITKEKGLIPEQVIKNSGIERTYGHQIYNGTRNPSREKIIQLAFGLHLSLKETQKILTIGNRNLFYPRIKRDAAIIFCLNHQKDFDETQSILQSLNLTLLGHK